MDYFIGERNMMPSCMISALTADRLIRKGCEAFLACVVSLEGSGSNLVDILMVCRFLRVSRSMEMRERRSALE